MLRNTPVAPENEASRRDKTFKQCLGLNIEMVAYACSKLLTQFQLV